MKKMQKFLLTAAFAFSIPVLASAATYDDLIGAAKMGDTPSLVHLVGKGASVDTTDIEGNTLLMLAARDGHGDLVQLLINHRAKLNARNAAGDTALALAAKHGWVAHGVEML